MSKMPPDFSDARSDRNKTSEVILQTSDPTLDYDFKEKIGSGTYGEVYRASSFTLDMEVAIKVIRVVTGDDMETIKLEIQLMENLKHLNIISYFGSYLRDSKLYITMEYCGGGSMQDIYSVCGGFTEDQICYVCRETLMGLKYLHERQMIHRDIKGANILITNTGYIKLADFGVSAKITATIQKRNSFIGTPYWMAPEVAAVEKKGGYNELCDVWAVGITAIELAETSPPEYHEHPMRVLLKMTKNGYKPPSLTEKDRWSLNFNQFVKFALTKSVKKRPSARDMLEMPFFGCLPADLSSVGLELLGRVKAISQENLLKDCMPNQQATLKISSKIEENTIRPSSSSNLSDNVEPLPAVPPRRSKSLEKPPQLKPIVYNRSNTNITHGLPPTPKVHMGACFTKIFNGFPHKINHCAKWIHPDTKDVIILIASSVGIYGLNLNEIAEGEMQLYFNKTTNWIYVNHNVMVSLSGRSSCLYVHDLKIIWDYQFREKKLTKILFKAKPTNKIPNSKGCVKCCVGRNPYNGYRYIGAAFRTKIMLFQWYEELRKHVLIKEQNILNFYPGNVFEMFITPDLEFPLICHGVHSKTFSNDVRFDIVDLNYDDIDSTHPHSDKSRLAISEVMQLNKDIILISYDNIIKIVSLSGIMKSNKKQLSYLTFKFKIDSIACLRDSVLAFHKSGMQGRSFKKDEITQEITDDSKVHEFFKMGRDILLDCRKYNIDSSDLFMLAGHENTT